MALKTGLVSLWNETGTVTEDIHGSNTLTNFNTVTTGTGKIGTGSDFEASSSQYLRINDGSQSGLDVTTQFSLCFWMNFETASVPMFIRKYGGAGVRSYLFEFTGTDTLTFRATLSGDGTAGDTRSSTTTVTPGNGTYHHYGMSYNAGTIKYYYDGSQLGSDVTSSVTSIFSSSANFFLGSSNGTGQYIDGVLNQTAFWNVEKSATDFSDIYNGGSGLLYSSWDAGGAVTQTANSTLLTLGVG